MPVRLCLNKNTLHYGETNSHNRCPDCGSRTRKLFGFSGPVSVVKNVRSNVPETRFPPHSIGPCVKHGWSCRVFDDHSSRR